MTSLSDEERKAKHAAWKREWRKNNPDKTKAAAKRSNAKYRASHKDDLNAKAKEWHKANKETANAKRNALYKANKESEKAKQKLYRQANREKIAESRKKRPDIYLAANRRRRARLFNSQHIPYTETEVLKTYGTDCHICNESIDLSAPRKVGLPGWENGLHIEHVIPLAKQGANSLENVRPAHGLCNLKKHY